mmetsp:Transcript_365/g.1332  ORF Transcript_365/g.1332 Transcript_365/m.1332 type:complete len:248 (-) Transcript_365:780-1523(-)
MFRGLEELRSKKELFSLDFAEATTKKATARPKNAADTAAWATTWALKTLAFRRRAPTRPRRPKGTDASDARIARNGARRDSAFKATPAATTTPRAAANCSPTHRSSKSATSSTFPPSCSRPPNAEIGAIHSSRAMSSSHGLGDNASWNTSDPDDEDDSADDDSDSDDDSDDSRVVVWIVWISRVPAASSSEDKRSRCSLRRRRATWRGASESAAVTGSRLRSSARARPMSGPRASSMAGRHWASDAE